MMDVDKALAMADLIEHGGKPDATAAKNTIRTLAAEVRRLQGAVPAGHVRDEKGVDVPFVGTLPRTADGVIVGHGATVYVNDMSEVYQGRADCAAYAWFVTPPPQDGFRRAYCKCYSTRGAAEAARERGKA